MMIDRRLIQEVDWVLLGLILLQSLIGVFFIYSSSHFLPGNYYVPRREIQNPSYSHPDQLIRYRLSIFRRHRDNTQVNLSPLYAADSQNVLDRHITFLLSYLLWVFIEGRYYIQPVPAKPVVRQHR